MVRYFGIWVGGLAVALMTAACYAQETKTDVQAGKAHVQVEANATETGGPAIQVEVNGKPVPIQVEKAEGRSQGVRVHAGPVQVETGKGSKGGVNVNAGPVQVETRKGPGGRVQVHAGPVQVFSGWGKGDQTIKPSEYWIGLELQPAPEALRVQLGLPEEQGLVVSSVVPEGPAAKAGIKKYDVLLTAGDKPLGELADLIGTIDKTKGEPMALGLIRGGKSKKIVVTPAKRPEAAPDVTVEAPRAWREYAEQFLPGRVEGKGPFRFRFFHPGVIVSAEGKLGPKNTRFSLPNGVSVKISKEGDEPAKIIVKRGKETWEVTEKTLDELPEDVRASVEPMVTAVLVGQQVDVFPSLTAPGQPEVQLPEGLEFHEAKPQTRLERRLEAMNRRIEELRESVDKLRESRK